MHKMIPFWVNNRLKFHWGEQEWFLLKSVALFPWQRQTFWLHMTVTAGRPFSGSCLLLSSAFCPSPVPRILPLSLHHWTPAPVLLLGSCLSPSTTGHWGLYLLLCQHHPTTPPTLVGPPWLVTKPSYLHSEIACYSKACVWPATLLLLFLQDHLL